MPTPRRRHGCHPPFKLEQVAAVAAWAVVVAAGYGLVAPVAFAWPGARDAAVGCLAVYTFLVVMVLILHLVTSLVNPEELGAWVELPDDPPEGTWFCQACQRYEPPGTKHCNACNKCVSGFDHHCVWLNCCIGARNYIPFFSLLNAVVGLLALEAACAFALFIAGLLPWGRAPLTGALTGGYRVQGQLPAFAGPLYLASMAAVVLLAAGLLSSLSGLWAMHWVLLAKGATTWDMIRILGEGRWSSSGDASGAGAAGLCHHLLPWQGACVTPQDTGTGPQVPGGISSGGSAMDASTSSGGGRRKRVPISPFVALRLQARRGSSGSGGTGVPRQVQCRGCGFGAVAPDDGSGFDAAARSLESTPRGVAPSRSSVAGPVPSLAVPPVPPFRPGQPTASSRSPGGAAGTGTPQAQLQLQQREAQPPTPTSARGVRFAGVEALPV